MKFENAGIDPLQKVMAFNALLADHVASLTEFTIDKNDKKGKERVWSLVTLLLSLF